jgi:hypothetical protein
VAAQHAKLQAISNLCVFMYVGELDEYMWHGEMKQEAEYLRSKGTVARYTVEKGQAASSRYARRGECGSLCSTASRRRRRAARLHERSRDDRRPSSRCWYSVPRARRRSHAPEIRRRK